LNLGFVIVGCGAWRGLHVILEQSMNKVSHYLGLGLGNARIGAGRDGGGGGRPERGLYLNFPRRAGVGGSEIVRPDCEDVFAVGVGIIIGRGRSFKK